MQMAQYGVLAVIFSFFRIASPPLVGILPVPDPNRSGFPESRL
jgi:hypothetical protein